MEVVLLKDVERLGKANDIVTVKNGYGRNYLIPQKMALLANESNRKKVEEIMKQEKLREDKVLAEFKDQVDKIQNSKLTVGAKVGTTGKIFGSVTNIQLAEAIKNIAKVEVDRKKITIVSEEIKALGTYEAALELHPKVKVNFNFEVVED